MVSSDPSVSIEWPFWDSTEQNPEERAQMRTLTRLAARENQRYPQQARKMCATCAFRPGTEANRSRQVLRFVRDQIAREGMFHCHAGLPVDADGFIRATPPRVCEGFVGLQIALCREEEADRD